MRLSWTSRSPGQQVGQEQRGMNQNGDLSLTQRSSMWHILTVEFSTDLLEAQETRRGGLDQGLIPSAAASREASLGFSGSHA